MSLLRSGLNDLQAAWRKTRMFLKVVFHDLFIAIQERKR